MRHRLSEALVLKGERHEETSTGRGSVHSKQTFISLSPVSQNNKSTKHLLYPWGKKENYLPSQSHIQKKLQRQTT